MSSLRSICSTIVSVLSCGTGLQHSTAPSQSAKGHDGRSGVTFEAAPEAEGVEEDLIDIVRTVVGDVCFTQQKDMNLHLTLRFSTGGRVQWDAEVITAPHQRSCGFLQHSYSGLRKRILEGNGIAVHSISCQGWTATLKAAQVEGRDAALRLKVETQIVLE